MNLFGQLVANHGVIGGGNFQNKIGSRHPPDSISGKRNNGFVVIKITRQQLATRFFANIFEYRLNARGTQPSGFDGNRREYQFSSPCGFGARRLRFFKAEFFHLRRFGGEQ